MGQFKGQQISSLIQHALSTIFLKEGFNLYGSAMVTITSVNITPDYSIARVYLSIFNTDDSEETLDLIRDNKGEIRGWLGKHIKNKVRKIPSLEFFLDETLDEVFKIEKIFKDLNEPSNGDIA